MPSTRTHKTKRGFTYSYLFSPASDGKPTLLFLHGFPSTHDDWRHQIKYFGEKGYGLIVPDMLGYGGTDKPTDPESFAALKMAGDIVEIVDTEGVKDVIAIGHDWGSTSISRLANLYQHRFLGFAWLAVGYRPPDTQFDLDKILAFNKQKFGSELRGYWLFFNKPESASIIESRLDSFMSMLYPGDPVLWKTDMAPPGSIEAYLATDRRDPGPSWITLEEKAKWKETFSLNGFESPLQWYRAQIRGINSKGAESIPQDDYHITKPTFFGACLKDGVCLAPLNKRIVETFTKDSTIVEFDTGHWVQLEKPNLVNNELEKWIENSILV